MESLKGSFRLARPRPFPVAATICTAAGLVVLCGLGVWQHQRLGWKNDLQAMMDREFAKDAQSIDLTASDLAALDKTSIRRGTLSGMADFNHVIRLQGQIAEKKPATYLLFPLRLEEGPSVYVVAGYYTGESPALPMGDAALLQVTGIARQPHWSSFMPENDPEKELWYRPDVTEMAKHQNIADVIPVLVYRESRAGDGFDNLPAPPIPHELRNDHRQYMMFWFTMAAVLAVIYVLRFWRQPASPK